MTEEEMDYVNVSKEIQPDIIVSGELKHPELHSNGNNNLPKIRQDYDWEVPVTMNHTWAYKEHNHWKSTSAALAIDLLCGYEWKLFVEHRSKSRWFVPEEALKDCNK